MTDETECSKATEAKEGTEEATEKTPSSQAELDKRIEKLEGEIAQCEDRYLRSAAELRNYRKRVADQRVQQLQYAHEQLAVALLPVLDHMELALQSARSEDQSPQEILSGVEMTYRQFQEVLQQFGLSRVNTVGEQFDTSLHEAVERRTVDDEEVAGGEIVEESRSGYKLHNRVVRPAQVCVCVKQEDAGEQPTGEEQCHD